MEHPNTVPTDISKEVIQNSMDDNGYVREKALDILIESGNENAIAFIVYRLRDWVPIIRYKAAAGMERFKTKKHVPKLVYYVHQLHTYTTKNEAQKIVFDHHQHYRKIPSS